MSCNFLHKFNCSNKKILNIGRLILSLTIQHVDIFDAFYVGNIFYFICLFVYVVKLYL